MNDDTAQAAWHQEQVLLQELEELGGRCEGYTTEQLTDLYRSLRPEDAWKRHSLMTKISRVKRFDYGARYPF